MFLVDLAFCLSSSHPRPREGKELIPGLTSRKQAELITDPLYVGFSLRGSQDHTYGFSWHTCPDEEINGRQGVATGGERKVQPQLLGVFLVFFWLWNIPGLHKIRQNKANHDFHCFQRNLTA